MVNINVANIKGCFEFFVWCPSVPSVETARDTIHFDKLDSNVFFILTFEEMMHLRWVNWCFQRCLADKDIETTILFMLLCLAKHFFFWSSIYNSKIISLSFCTLPISKAGPNSQVTIYSGSLKAVKISVYKAEGCPFL